MEVNPLRFAWSPDDDILALSLIASGKTAKEIAAIMGRTVGSVQNRTTRFLIARVQRPTLRPEKSAEATPGETWWESKNADETVMETVVSEPVKTEEDLKRVCQIDTEVWEAERLTCNAWTGFMRGADGQPVTVQNYQVKAWLRKRKEHLEALRRIEVYKELAGQFSPSYTAVTREPKPERLAAVVALFDAHLNKLAWPDEVGGGAPYDLKIAIDIYRTAMTDLLQRIEAEGVEKVVYLVGQDFLNIDTLQSTTTRGTVQHSDSRFQKAYDEGFKLLVWAIDQMRLIAPVTVIAVPGNHDRQVTFTMAHALQSWYRLDPEVRFDNSASSRKYWRFGQNLICIAHGDEVKPKDLPLTMAAERPVEWAHSLYREVYTGHLHQRALSEHKGVLVRICPSLSATDAWHYNSGYVCNRRAAEAYIYRHEGALRTVFHHDVPPTLPPALVDAA